MSRARSVADLGNQNVLSVSATNGNINVGTGVTLENTGEAQFSGIVTALSIDTRNLIGDVSIGGVLTYEDVTSVDSVGIVTAGNGLRVTDGGLVVTAGISTFAGITTVTGETLFTKQLNVSGVSTLGSNVVVGGATTELVVTGDARVTGILTVGTASLTLDGATGNVSGASLHDTQISAISKEITDSNVVDVFVYDTSKDSDGGAWRKRTSHTSWYNETLNTATRGSRKEFPAVAVIVAEDHKLTIYDGDDPDLPMWMVFNADTSAWNTNSTFLSIAYSPSDDMDISSVKCLNAKLVVSGDQHGVVTIDFINESQNNRRPDIDSGKVVVHKKSGSIASRNDTSGHNATTNTQVIVNRFVNDVAMTVLPNAPVDDTTGLPIPTIAVATDGGVSVIKDDGIVVDKATTAEGVSMVAFTDVDKLIAKNTNVNYIGIFDDIVTNQSSNYIGNILDATFTFDGVFESDPRYNYPNPTGTVNNNADVVNLKDKTFAFGVNEGSSASTSNGINILQYTTGSDTDNNGILVGVTTSYNTGWMHGNNKGAFLSDTTVESLSANTNLATSATANGYNRLTSETYDNGDTSWQMVDNAGSSNGYVKIELTNLVVGQTYVISMTWDNNAILDTSSNYQHKIQHQDGTASENFTEFLHWNKTNGSAETLTGLFTAQTTNNENLVMYCNAITLNVSNFNVRAVDDEDRSVNNNGLQVFGTITKSPVVGTGVSAAELVGYSGFSASSNLVQPYNSDLDFGTGDFSIMGWINVASSVSNYASILSRVVSTNTETGAWSLRIDNSAGNYYFYSNSASLFTSPLARSTWQFLTVTRRSNVVYFYVNGDFRTTGPMANSITNVGANVVVGYEATHHIGNSSVALWRISGSAPSPEQIKKIYEDEKVLFQENAACTLYGSSDAVTALAYDDTTELLHVGTSSGRSEFQGLSRINNTTTAVTTAISASNDLVAEK